MDEKRILSKIDELDSYLEELEKIKPADLEEYIENGEKKRACERLLQLVIETMIDTGNLLLIEKKLGLPADEDDVFDKLKKNKVISPEMEKTLSGMKGMRNILVHKYAEVNDELVFEAIHEHLGDFDKFKGEVLNAVG